jgi:hypothetical protein
MIDAGTSGPGHSAGRPGLHCLRGSWRVRHTRKPPLPLNPGQSRLASLRRTSQAIARRRSVPGRHILILKFTLAAPGRS